MFFSSAFFPRETMTGWFKAVADVNPISYLVEGMRDQIIETSPRAGDADRARRGDGAVGGGSSASPLAATTSALLRRRLGRAPTRDGLLHAIASAAASRGAA